MRHRQGLELSEPEDITRPWDLSRLLEAECFKREMKILGRRNNLGNNEGPRVKKGSRSAWLKLEQPANRSYGEMHEAQEKGFISPA